MGSIRSESNLKSFQPLIKSLSITSQRSSVALNADYFKSIDRLNEILQAKAEQQQQRQLKRGSSKISQFKSTLKETFKFAMTSGNPLPENPNMWQRFLYALRMPPHGILGKWITGIFVLGIIYCALYSIFKDEATPFPKCKYKDKNDSEVNGTTHKHSNYCTANVYGLFIVISASMIIGSLFQMCYLPPLLGMLSTGIILGNVNAINTTYLISTKIIPLLRKLALVVILTRAGLCLDPKILRSLSAAVFRLAFIPCCIEACACALASYLILNYNAAWGFTLGFVLGAVSPAVVVLSMLKLELSGYGVDKGIPTLVIAAASMDDVLAISGHSFAMGIALPPKQKSSTAWKVLKGPIEVIVGITYGIVLGVLFWYIPNRKHNRLKLFRVILLMSGGIIALLGSKTPIIAMPAAGAVGCLTLSFVAGIGWRERDGWREEQNPIIPVVDTIWWIAQPTLFSLIGTEINFTEIIGKGFWLLKALAVMFIALLCRMLVSFLCVARTGLDLQEMFFVSLAWIPKATVQAAIGPLAKDYVQTAGPSSNIEAYNLAVTTSDEILIVGCLSILLTAPLGAFLINLTGPYLLKQVRYNDTDHSDGTIHNSRELSSHAENKDDSATLNEDINFSDKPLFPKM